TDQDRSGHTPLMYAVMTKHAEMTAWLISLGANLNDTNFLDMTPLNLAAGMGAVDCAELLIAAGASLEPVNGDPVITNAASSEMVRTLISHGADINAVNGEGYWLLKSAAEEGNYPFTCELLDLGADPDATSTGATALHTAVMYDQLEIVTALLQHGADPNAYDVDSWTPLMYANSLECVELLLAAGAEIGATDICDDDVIQHHTDPEIIQRLQAAGASIETQPEALNSLLHTAASAGDLRLLNYLLAQHLNVNTPLSTGVTPLMAAAEHGHTTTLQRLLESGADLHASDDEGRTALFYAATPEAFLAFQLALEHSAEEAKNDLLKELVELPAETRELFDQLDFSLDFGYKPSDDITSLDLLIDAGANLEARDSEGATPLLVACRYGRPARVERLIQRGADQTALDFEQRSAQELTTLHHDRDQAAQILKLLQQSE
ncbi:MAG: ankyrin repeat domain-containing protein, partial [Planctomycetaceae bacterium]|nr:ankyrin repeat domain-containing protein [Planctomycetaceae bacterium]